MALKLEIHFSHKGIAQDIFLIDLIWIHFYKQSKVRVFEQFMAVVNENHM